MFAGFNDPCLRDFLLQIGFTEGASDTSLFVYNKDDVQTFLLVYVDDIVITSSSSINICTVINWSNMRLVC